MLEVCRFYTDYRYPPFFAYVCYARSLCANITRECVVVADGSRGSGHAAVPNANISINLMDAQSTRKKGRGYVHAHIQKYIRSTQHVYSLARSFPTNNKTPARRICMHKLVAQAVVNKHTPVLTMTVATVYAVAESDACIPAPHALPADLSSPGWRAVEANDAQGPMYSCTQEQRCRDQSASNQHRE